MGSRKLRVIGFTSVIITMSLPVILSPTSIGSHVSFSLPVNLRNLMVRRYMMFADDVSGKKKKTDMVSKPQMTSFAEHLRNTKQKPDSHVSSQIVQVQPLASAAKP